MSTKWAYNSGLQSDPNECFYCGHPMGLRRRSREHILPKFHGGNNSEFNMVLVHSKCNFLRGCKKFEELLNRLPDGFIRNRVVYLQSYVSENKKLLSCGIGVQLKEVKPAPVADIPKPEFRWEDYLGGGYFHID